MYEVLKCTLLKVVTLNVLYSQAALFQFLLRVVRDVDKAESGCAVAFIIIQSCAEELGTEILEQG